MADIQLQPEVKDILQQSTITATSVVLPSAILPPPLYRAVDKALNHIGGKWNGRARAHLFTSDPRPKIQLALETGVVPDEKKAYQSFFTPPELAHKLAEMADVKGKGVLEPSAGRGAIADACRDAGASSVSCVELNPEHAAHLRAKGYKVFESDFLQVAPAPTFDCVVMNPPFTRNQDIEHVLHACGFVAQGGTLVAVMLANENRKGFDEILSRAFSEIEYLPRGTFKESGTDVATMVLTLMFDEALTA